METEGKVVNPKKIDKDYMYLCLFLKKDFDTWLVSPIIYENSNQADKHLEEFGGSIKNRLIIKVLVPDGYSISNFIK